MQMEIVQASYAIFSLSCGTRDRGGGVQIEFFPGENSRPATHRAKHTLGRGGHFICHRGVSYYGKNTTFTIKRFPSKPGGHFLEARRAFFCPRAAGVRNPVLLPSIVYCGHLLSYFFLQVFLAILAFLCDWTPATAAVRNVIIGDFVKRS